MPMVLLIAVIFAIALVMFSKEPKPNYDYYIKIPNGWTVDKNNSISLPPYVVDKNIVYQSQLTGPTYKSKMNGNRDEQSFIKIMIIKDHVKFKHPFDFATEAGLIQSNMLELSHREKYIKRSKSGAFVIDELETCFGSGCQEYRIINKNGLVYLLACPALSDLTVSDPEYVKYNLDLKNTIESALDSFRPSPWYKAYF